MKPLFHTENVFGNRFAYFEFPNPQGAQIIAHKFKATVWQLDWNVEPAKVEKVAEWPTAFDKFRRAERNILIDDRVKKLASDVAGNTSPAGDLAAVMDWISANMTYDHSATSLLQALRKSMRSGFVRSWTPWPSALPTSVAYAV